MIVASRCMARSLALSVAALVALVSGPAPRSTVAADPPAGVRQKLFNGVDLTGWHVTGCEAGVENGSLVIQKGDGFVRTDHRYQDFILELEWKPRKADDFDSGIYFRCDLPQGKPWPDRYQINLKNGYEGNLVSNPRAVSQGLVKAGDWNRLKLTVTGDRATAEINGKPAWSVEGIEVRDGYLGLQVEEPLGGQFEFREIYVTELGYRSLFNGRDLDGWEGAGDDAAKCWTVDGDAIVCTGKPGPWLRSREKFGDFNLRLEYKVKAGGNSGVYVRVPADGNHHGPGSGVEIQVLDDAAPRYKDLKAYQYTGSVYAVVPASRHVGRAAETWNSLEINCHGTHYRIGHNGVWIVDADVDTYPGLAERLVEGFLGLQNHSEEVWFRNLRVGPGRPPEYRGHQDVRYFLDEKGRPQPVRTTADWERRRQQILEGMQTVMGKLPGPEKLVPLDVQQLEEVRLDGGLVRRKISYQTERDDRVQAYLFLPPEPADAPAGSIKRRAAVLCLHQTTGIGKSEPAGLGGSPNLHYALHLAQRGYVTLAPDYPSFGEHPFDFADPKFGYTSGTMKAIWDNRRAIDLLETLPQVDKERIGCIGHSLGGHNTMFTAAFEPRIKALVSNCGFTRFHKYYDGKLAGWTSDRYMPKIASEYGNDPNRVPFDFPEIVASFAPRPFLASSPVGDGNFEVSGVRETIAAAAPVYRLFGKAENLQANYPECGHDFPEDVRKVAYEFFDKHLGEPPAKP